MISRFFWDIRLHFFSSSSIYYSSSFIRLSDLPQLVFALFPNMTPTCGRSKWKCSKSSNSTILPLAPKRVCSLSLLKTSRLTLECSNDSLQILKFAELAEHILKWYRQTGDRGIMCRIRVPTIPKNIRGPAPAERLLSPIWAPYSKRSFALDPYSHPLLAGVMGFDLYPSNGQKIAASGQLIVERTF